MLEWNDGKFKYNGEKAVRPSLQSRIQELFWNDVDYHCCDQDLVWHYTSLTGGISITTDIISGKGAYLTNCRFLNDSEEFKFGINAAKHWLRHGGVNVLGNELAGKILERLKNKIGKLGCVPYVMSFSTLEDVAPMWMSYSKRNGGMALGFKRKKLMSDDEIALGQLRRLCFSPCIYVHELKIKEPQLSKIMELFQLSFYGYMMATCKLGNDERIDWCILQILKMASLIKRDEYRYEKEWRLVIFDPEKISEAEFVGDKLRIRVRNDECDFRNALHCICMSPHGDRDYTTAVCDALKAKSGGMISIRKSTSSYTGM